MQTTIIHCPGSGSTGLSAECYNALWARQWKAHSGSQTIQCRETPELSKLITT
jgi:hypothetical protein